MANMTQWPAWALYLIPALPLLGFLLNGTRSLLASHREKGPSVGLTAIIGCAMPILSFALAVMAFLAVRSLENHTIVAEPLWTWFSVPLLTVPFSFMVDPLTATMLLVVTGVGSLIHLYSIGYMKEDEGFTRYFAYLNLFLFFMLLLILGDNLMVLFVGWEGVGLSSYLLIGFWFQDAEKAYAGKKAFVVNRIGDFGFLIGIFLIISALNSPENGSGLPLLNYSYLLAHKELLLPLAFPITLGLFLGATGKSAQIPLYVWLPDAMAGPTPVSALIHAATMVTAGVYMVARLFFLFEMAPRTLDIIAAIGLATALLAALIAITQTDIKKVLAYSTVSQLGFMFLALGVHAPQAAIFHVVTHAFFKACLFLCAGSVIYSLHHEQDIRHMGGLFKKIPATAIAFLISTLAIAGIPPFSGFFSKDEILLHTFAHAPRAIYVVALFVAGLTSFYMFRLFAVVFLGKPRFHHAEPVPSVMNGPVLILAILAAVGGLMGVPHVLGGHNAFQAWLSYLSPVHALAVGHTTELTLMAVSTGWALLLGGISAFLYARNLGWTDSLKRNLSGVYRLMSNKFYVDELYQKTIVNPVRRFSETVLSDVSDKKMVDGILVHGWTDMAGFGARIVSKLQTGYIGHYLLYLWLGLGGLFILILMKSS